LDFFDREGLEAVASEGDGTQITVVVGDYIAMIGTSVVAATGNIPASLVSTSRSVILVSWLGVCGTDGIFSEDDIEAYGESLAHEAGHYAGLFHPVDGAFFDHWDALDDTEGCTDQSTCEASLGENLMFPYFVCSKKGCTRQRDLTPDQGGVLHRYTGVY
jgi:hypothetical protein